MHRLRRCVRLPRDLITLLPPGDPITVYCRNKDKGAVVRKSARPDV